MCLLLDNLNRFILCISPHSAINSLAAILPDPNILDVLSPGGWRPRAPDLLTIYMNGPQQADVFSKIIPGVNWDFVFENEYAELVPVAVKAVFGIDCRYQPTHRFDDLVQFIKGGQAIQLVLIHPGHYIAVHAYDDFTDELIYVDPNDRTHPDGNWSNCRMSRMTHDTNVKPHIVVY